MVNIKINGKEITVTEGTTILEAARRANIFIPSLCDEDKTSLFKTSVFGGCRVCLVEIEGNPRLVASCYTQVAENMSVKTDSERAKRIQRDMIELLLSDHPNDCLTCEKNGCCRLQELAYIYGIKENRFTGARRREKTEDINPFIVREFDKCIQCGRCVRACDEIRGVNAYCFTGRGFNTKVTTLFDSVLNCEFCGNCVDVCPTGSLTEKMSSGYGRIWDAKKVETICGYCGVGCGITLHVRDNKVLKVSPSLENPSNYGTLCVKGKFGLDFINHPDRLTVPSLKKEKRITTPLLKKNGSFVEVGWEEALDFVAMRLKEIKEEFGPDSIGGLSSAKCTNEENYLFQKFMRAVIGTNNVDHCARLCHSPSTIGLGMSLGTGAMTNSTDDFLMSDAIFVIGSNTIEAHPVAALKLKKAVREKGAKLIVADPRKIELVKFATVWLPLRPGTNSALLNGLAHVMLNEGLINSEFIEAKTENYDAFKAAIGRYTPELVEKLTGVSKDRIIKAARIYGSAKRGSIFYGMGITQHTTGTETVLALANLALMTGHIGKEGTGVNPLRGQNNVQGACDMGALPNVYPGYQKVDDPAARKKFEAAWSVSLNVKPGLFSTEMVNSVLDPDEKKHIRAMYIMGENPLISDPDYNHTKKALEKLDLLIVQDIFYSDTAEMAHVVLPGVSFAEKNGTYINTDRRVQRLRQAITPLGESREDLDIIKMLSQKIGYKMNNGSQEAVWDEIRSLWPAVTGITYSRIEKLGIQWPCPTTDHPGTKFLYKDGFPRGRAKFHAVEFMPSAELPDDKYPFILTTGRLLFHFHTGTMTRRSKGISEAVPEGNIEVNPTDAGELGIADMQLVKVVSRRGEIKIKAKVTDRVQKGVVFIPFHFAEAAANMLTNNVLDPYAKMAELKSCAVKIETNL